MPGDDPPTASDPPVIGRAGRRLLAGSPAVDRAATGGSTRWAIASLLAVNLAPLVGVLGFGWSTLELMTLYWFENGIVGLFAVLKLLLAGRGRRSSPMLGRLFTAGFFTMHYGAFWSVHGLFVMALFGGPTQRAFGAMETPLGFFFGGFGIAAAAVDGGLRLASMGLLASHAVSFVGNVVLRGEDLDRPARELMTQPYGRVALLHLTLVLGGFLVLGVGEPAAALALFVLLKTAADLAAHLRAHRPR